MSELRQHPLTGDWVIVAPERGQRPQSHPMPQSAAHGSSAAPQSSSPPPECPFCRGKESLTPPELWRLGGRDGDWRVRVVPNKFAVLSPERTPSPLGDGGLVALVGAGHHEVVVEHPEHGWDLSTAAEREVRDVLEAYRARHRALHKAGAATIVVFRNHGAASGTSLEHPHSQLIGLPIVPERMSRLIEAARRHRDRGRSLFADALAREVDDGRRAVARSERFVAFQPFASAFPFETWIVPRAPERGPAGAPEGGPAGAPEGATDLCEAPDDLLDELAPMLRAVLAALGRALGDPPYNLLLNGARCGEAEDLDVRWHLQIVPRLSLAAGFELATGVAINPSLPEETASVLREEIARDGWRL